MEEILLDIHVNGFIIIIIILVPDHDLPFIKQNNETGRQEEKNDCSQTVRSRL